MCVCALKESLLWINDIKKLFFWGFEISSDLFALKIFSIIHVFLNECIAFLKLEKYNGRRCFKTKGLSPVRQAPPD